MKQKPYPRPVYRWGGGRNCSKSRSLNMWTDLRINGHSPEYVVIGEHGCMGEGVLGNFGLRGEVVYNCSLTEKKLSIFFESFHENMTKYEQIFGKRKSKIPNNLKVILLELFGEVYAYCKIGVSNYSVLGVDFIQILTLPNMPLFSTSDCGKYTPQKNM